MQTATLIFGKEVISVYSSSILGLRYADGVYYLYVADPGSQAVGCFRFSQDTMKAAAHDFDHGDHPNNVLPFRPAQLGWLLKWIYDRPFIRVELVAGILSHANGDYGNKSGQSSAPKHNPPEIN